MRTRVIHTLRVVGHRGSLLFQVAVLIVAGLAPALTFEKVAAAQLTSRSAEISSSAPGETGTSITFSYTIPSTGTKAGIIYDFCTNPLGTCTGPTGLDVSGATHVSQDTDWPSDSVPFAVASSTGDCTADANTVCFSRDEGTATETDGGVEVEHVIGNVTNPTTAQTVYIRISIYNNNDFLTANLLDQGTVAVAYVNQLTVTGRVAERLEFCVGAMVDQDGSTTNEDTPADCDTGFPTATEVTLGVIDNDDIYVTPVEDTTDSLSTDTYGLAIVSTNASGGVSVAYFAEPQTNVSNSDTDQLRAFRVAPTDCSATATSVTDQCFVSADEGGEDFSQGDEMFGMYIPCIDQHHDGIVTQNLSADADYVGVTGGTGTAADAQEVDADSAETCQHDESSSVVHFAFNDTSTPEEIATSAGSADGVVDNEAIKIGFGATASPTTPEGSYFVVLTYIATPTF